MRPRASVISATLAAGLLLFSSPLRADPELIKAFAFGTYNIVCPTRNVPAVNYTLVYQQGNDTATSTSLAYNAARGWGYEVMVPGSVVANGYGQFGLNATGVNLFDESPNNRAVFPDTCPEQLYDSFIGVKNFSAQCDEFVVGNRDDPCTVGAVVPEGIIFRVDVPNGKYRFVAAVGSASNLHAHRILAEDGGSGPPPNIGPQNVVLVKNYDQAEHGAGVFAQVGFSCFSLPTASNGTVPRFKNMDRDGVITNGPPDSPTLEVTQGYIRIHQLQANSNAGAAGGRDPNGGDMVILELWKVTDEASVPPTVVRSILSNPYAPGDTVRVTLTASDVSSSATITENIPAGWTVSDNGGGVVSGSQLTFTTTQSGSFTYGMLAPADINVQLVGTVKAVVAGCSGFESLVGGDSTLVRAVPAPQPITGGNPQDLGVPLLPGSQEEVSLDPRKINIWASGFDIWDAADEGRFVDFGDFSDFDLSCIVAGLDVTNPWSKAGIMARTSGADPSSAYAFIMVSGSNGTDFQYRDDVALNAANRGPTGAAGILREMRLMRRSGSLIEAFARVPGAARWQRFGTRDMPNLATRVGLAVTSHDINLVAGAKFENVVISTTPPAALAPPTNLSCTLVAGKIKLTFSPPAGAKNIEVTRMGTSLIFLPGIATSYTDPTALAGDAYYSVVAYDAQGVPSLSASCFASLCQPSPTAPPATLVKAFAFGSRPLDCSTFNDLAQKYTIVLQDPACLPDGPTCLLYDPNRGWGYEVLYPDDVSRGGYGIFGPFDDSANNRGQFPDDCPEQLYDSFIGAKTFPQTCTQAVVGNPNDPCTTAGLRPDGIIFRVDVPSGTYRFVAAVGSADNLHAHRILAENGGEGPPENIGEHVVLVSNHDQGQYATGVFARVGFEGKIPPPGDLVAPGPRFVNMDENGLATQGCPNSPMLEVTEDHLRIHQLQANSNNGPGGVGDPNGGDMVILELWRIVLPPPNAPQNLVATPGDGKVDLTWDAPVAGGTSFNAYRLYRDGTRIADVPAAQRTYSDQNVLGGTRYCYVVRSLQGDTLSADSNQSCATPTGGTLNAPGSLTATGGQKQVSLNWSAPSGPAPTAYTIHRGPKGGPYLNIAEVNAPATSYTNTGLADDTEFCYVVKSKTPAVESGPSLEACARTLPPAGTPFRRGDADGDGAINLTDPIYTLANQFQGGPAPPCMDAADADDEGDYNLTDAIFSLQWQFLAGKEPPKPGPFICGLDETNDVFVDCTYTKCAP